MWQLTRCSQSPKVAWNIPLMKWGSVLKPARVLLDGSYTLHCSAQWCFWLYCGRIKASKTLLNVRHINITLCWKWNNNSFPFHLIISAEAQGMAQTSVCVRVRDFERHKHTSHQHSMHSSWCVLKDFTAVIEQGQVLIGYEISSSNCLLHYGLWRCWNLNADSWKEIWEIKGKMSSLETERDGSFLKKLFKLIWSWFIGAFYKIFADDIRIRLVKKTFGDFKEGQDLIKQK